MEYSELIVVRYSVKTYRPDPVENVKLQAVLEAARLAPTAANRQPIQLVVMHTVGREEIDTSSLSSGKFLLRSH